jgi:hypothetical protein
MGVRMAEGSIDNAITGNTEYEFSETDARQQIILRQKAIICCMIQVEDIFQVRVVVCNTRQDAVIVVAVL